MSLESWALLGEASLPQPEADGAHVGPHRLDSYLDHRQGIAKNQLAVQKYLNMV